MIGAVKIIRMDHTAANPRDLAAKSNDAARVRRLLALALILEGQSRRAAATQAGMDCNFCVTGSIATTSKGCRALRPIRSGRRPASPSEAQMAESKELAIKGPRS
jgi:transposase